MVFNHGLFCFVLVSVTLPSSGKKNRLFDFEFSQTFESAKITL